MIVLNFDEYNLHKKTILKEIQKSVFVYPTDVFYGIGCNAKDEKLVAKLRKIKKANHPFSIIVPNKEWIYKNCIVDKNAEEWIRKLPGPYTLILKLKNKNAVAKNVYDAKKDYCTIGVRMPNHWFLAVVFLLKFPIVCTSANVTGSDLMTCLDDLDADIRNNVDYVFYEGPKKGSSLTMVHLEDKSINIFTKKESNLDNKNSDVSFPLNKVKLIEVDEEE